MTTYIAAACIVGLLVIVWRAGRPPSEESGLSEEERNARRENRE